MARALFISFTSLISEFQKSAVSEEELRTGIFYFGCVRLHVFEPGANGDPDETQWFYRDDPEGRAHVLKVVQDAVILAEEQGRIVWRKLHGNNTYEQLNDLLRRNGYPELDIDDNAGSYNYPTVLHAVLAQEIDLRVVWA